MSTLRLDASSADITLLTTADGRSFPAHKLILSTRSPVFAAMFRNGDFTENQKKLVEIDDISGEVMEGLLKYVYECNVQGIEKIVCGLLTAADKVRQREPQTQTKLHLYPFQYDIPHLVKECIQVMSNNLSVTNAASFFYYANLHQFENLKIQIGAFIVANKGAVRQSEGFKECIKLHSDLVDQFIDLII